MVDRLETPDIMSSLMSETSKQESNKEIKQEKPLRKKAIKPSSNKTILKQMFLDGTEEEITVLEELKEKATFNLSVKTLRDLEDKWIEIRRLSGSKQISKTLIVEKAIEMALAEFDLKKQIGKFYSKLVSDKDRFS
ncbi:hypothetical protein [Candidatus Rhabdochlamydia porcellionis]|jgi:hypothetical protein|uniref:Uncharacterized protein n=1 Tax=Candidatus Rhabdochlamydia porcellionis TaxID=225148 RepID=A0ABX8Z615_9BACT|nr:hypothetical protein [Candidatus Rhabdochlamydia porcellionis]QZA59467.1 hypothetical protein RHAB15C_0001401 [Candidatus Rhabdochlamydia porcellionis]